MNVSQKTPRLSITLRTTVLMLMAFFWAVTVHHHGIIQDTDASLMSVMSSGHHAAPRHYLRKFLSIQFKDFDATYLHQIETTLVSLCRKHGLNPKFVLGIIQIESRFDVWAVSPKGAIGLLQLMPDTAQWMTQRLGMQWTGPMALFDPILNLRIGVEYLGYLKGKYGYDMKAVLSAYNAGPTKFERDREAGKGYRNDYYKHVKAFLLSDRSSHD